MTKEHEHINTRSASSQELAETVQEKSFFSGVPVYQEPKMGFRFTIKFEGLDIPEHLFRGYKLYNDADQLMFETSFYETLDKNFNPLDFFKIYDVKVTFLDPTGLGASSWNFSVKGIAFENVGDYGKSELFVHKFVFEVDKKSFEVKNELK